MTLTPTIEFDSSYVPPPRTNSNGKNGNADARGLVNQKLVTRAAEAPTIRFGTTSAYTLMYNDKGSGAKLNGAFYRPKAPDGYHILGDYAQGNYQAPWSPSLTIQVINDDPSNPVLSHPKHYVQVWNDKGSGANMDGSIWMPVPHPGYTAIGAVAQTGYSMPDVEQLRCVRSDLVKLARIGALIWNDQDSGAHEDVEIYAIDGLSTFYAQGNYNPPTGPVWTLVALG